MLKIALLIYQVADAGFDCVYRNSSLPVKINHKKLIQVNLDRFQVTYILVYGVLAVKGCEYTRIEF
jgi:hypothetical protein